MRLLEETALELEESPASEHTKRTVGVWWWGRGGAKKEMEQRLTSQNLVVRTFF